MMKRTFIKLLILTLMLLGFPLLGIVLTNRPLLPYLEFPPQRHIVHAPFSWSIFTGCCILILLVILPFLIRGLCPRHASKRGPGNSFPWWVWAGILWTLLAWLVAWSRFSWTGPLQPHTFTPLWLGYIITINALTYRRKGTCMLIKRPGFVLMLFPASAAFWWFFEYLNRFVGNWYYVGVDFGPWEYFWYATLPFSTVLPAVMGTREWLLGFSWPLERFGEFLPLRIPNAKVFSWAVLIAAASGLTGIGILPNALFPLLWISPVLILISLQTIMGETHILSPITVGDWHVVLCSALAALICGCFWEMWNFYSLAKWKYSIPFVYALPIFEMPLLGYAGYLPFGLECAVVADMMVKKTEPSKWT